MADITVQFKDKKTGEVSETTIPEEKLKANKEQNPDYTITVIGAGLSPTEQDPVLAQVKAQREKEIGLGPTILGGLLQGVSLEAIDELKGTDKTLAKRQEAENPIAYNVSKFVGSLAPNIAGVGAGAALGSLLGPVGTVVGGVLGGFGTGAAESYFSKPEEGRELDSTDFTMGAVSGLTEGVGGKVAPMARGAYRGIRNKLLGGAPVKGTTEVVEDTLGNITKQINAGKEAAEKVGVNTRYREELGAYLDNLYKDASPEDKLKVADIAKTFDDIFVDPTMGGSPLKAAMKLDLAQKQLEVIKGRIGQYGKLPLGQPISTSVMGGAAAAVPQLAPNAPMTQEELAAYNKAIVDQAISALQAQKVSGLNAPPPLLVDEAEFAKQFKR